MPRLACEAEEGLDVVDEAAGLAPREVKVGRLATRGRHPEYLGMRRIQMDDAT